MPSCFIDFVAHRVCQTATLMHCLFERQHSRQVSLSQIEGEGEESESHELFISSQRRNAPITVSLRVNQVETTMEVDTGASVSIVSKATYKKLWSGGNFPLQPYDVKLCTYTGENLCIVGVMPAHVQYFGKCDKVCHGVAVEPTLQTLSGEQMALSSAITTDDARVDIQATGFWGD